MTSLRYRRDADGVLVAEVPVFLDDEPLYLSNDEIAEIEAEFPPSTATAASAVFGGKGSGPRPGHRSPWYDRGSKAKPGAPATAPDSQPGPVDEPSVAPAGDETPLVFNRKAEAVEWVSPIYEQWESDLDDHSRDVLEEYAGGSSQTMNGALRGQIKSSPDRERIHDFNETATRALHAAPPLPRAIRVTRGGFFRDRSVFQPGTVFRDDAFVSTAMGKRVPNTIGWNVKFDVVLPKGTRGAFLGDVASLSSEAEFLLPPGAEFRIGSVVNRGDTTVVEMELVDQDSLAKAVRRARKRP